MKYSLTVKAESEDKAGLRRVEVLVDPLVEGSVSFAFPTTKVNPFYVNNLIQIISCKGNLELK